jgi:hypothetical protein
MSCPKRWILLRDPQLQKKSLQVGYEKKGTWAAAHLVNGS